MSQFRAAILAVVSSPGQAADDKHSLEDQIEACEDVAERLEAVVVETLAFQHSRDYATLDMLCLDSPNHQRLIDLVKARAVNLIIMWKFDRLGRTTRLQLEALDYFDDYGVQAYSVMDSFKPPIDPDEFWRITRSASEEMMATVRASMAQYDNKQRLENMMRGKHGRARKGLHMNWARVPYGYIEDSERGHAAPLLPEPSEWPWLRSIFDARLRGDGGVAIANALNTKGVRTRRGKLWSAVTVKIIYTNAFYAGIVAYREWRKLPGGGRELVFEALYEGRHEPVITPTEWATIKRLNSVRMRDHSHAKHGEYALTGLAHCGFCGAGMTQHVKRYKSREWLAMSCSRYKRTGGRECHNNYHNAELVEADVRAAVKALVLNPESILMSRLDDDDHHERRIAALEASLADLDAQQQRILDAIQLGGFPVQDLTIRQNTLSTQRAQIRAELAGAKQRSEDHESLLSSAIGVRSVVDRLDRMTPRELRGVYRSLIHSVDLEIHEPPRIVWLG